MAKSNLGGEDLFNLTFPGNSPLLKEVRAGTQTGQECEGRSWCRGHGGVLPTDLLLMVCSVCFLTEPRTTSPGMVPPTVGWALIQQPLINALEACPPTA